MAILTLFARSAFEDFVIRHINTTLCVTSSSVIPTLLVVYYPIKLKDIFCIRRVMSPPIANNTAAKVLQIKGSTTLMEADILNLVMG